MKALQINVVFQFNEIDVHNPDVVAAIVKKLSSHCIKFESTCGIDCLFDLVGAEVVETEDAA